MKKFFEALDKDVFVIVKNPRLTRFQSILMLATIFVFAYIFSNIALIGFNNAEVGLASVTYAQPR